MRWIGLAALLAVTATGCVGDFGGLYEVTTHTIDLCADDPQPVAGGPTHVMLDQENDGPFGQIDVRFCTSADDCSDENEDNYRVAWGATAITDGSERSGSYSGGQCNVSWSRTVLSREDGGIRYDIERRSGSYPGSDIGLGTGTTGTEQNSACVDGIEEKPDRVPCENVEVLTATLLD